MHPARRLWTSLEPLTDVVYFAPAVRETGRAIGLRGYWMTYFAFRSAPLGPVGPDAVVAAFAGFEPSMVAKALPDAWSRTSPADCLAARLAVSVAALREVGVDEAACAEAVAELTPAAEVLDPTGRPLGAANLGLPLPADPVGALWQLATSLREHRGDGHVAALVAAGVSGPEALVLQAGAGKVPAELMRSVRGWPEAAWGLLADGLRSRDLLDDAGLLTPRGEALLTGVEERTDAVAWSSGLAALGEDGVERVTAALAPSVARLWASGMLPDVIPSGIARTGD